jgi:hypothetical protein
MDGAPVDDALLRDTWPRPTSTWTAPMPRPRSAMMLRWIYEVPPAMVCEKDWSQCTSHQGWESQRLRRLERLGVPDRVGEVQAPRGLDEASPPLVVTSFPTFNLWLECRVRRYRNTSPSCRGHHGGPVERARRTSPGGLQHRSGEKAEIGERSGSGSVRGPARLPDLEATAWAKHHIGHGQMVPTTPRHRSHYAADAQLPTYLASCTDAFQGDLLNIAECSVSIACCNESGPIGSKAATAAR